MKRWVSEGNCLLEREEVRFNVKDSDVPKIIKKIMATKQYVGELFFDKYKKVIVLNTVYDVPEAKDIKTFRRKNYIGARIRQYVSPDYKEFSFRFGEWKEKKNNKVVKSRVLLKGIGTISDFMQEINSLKLVFVMSVQYERKALNSKDKKIRITFDQNTIYTDSYGKQITEGIGVEEGITKVKVKFAGKKPEEIIDYIKRFSK